MPLMKPFADFSSKMCVCINLEGYFTSVSNDFKKPKCTAWKLGQKLYKQLVKL